ncbi:MAG: glycosyltransferase family 2 protein [Candidatus Pacearchaeota archaeon]
MKKAAIIIVNWNGKKFLRNCLNAVSKQTYKNYDVYFVDNGSIDGSFDYVKNNFPKTKTIQLDKNYGFAKGNNEGIKEAFKDKNVEYIVCLNNDTIVDKNWLKELVKTAEKDKNVGMVQSKIFLKDKKTLHSVGGILNYDFSSESRGFGEKDENQYNKEEEICLAIGCSVIIKRKVLERIGLFEEKFESYKEDDDLSLRVKLAGYLIYYSPTSIVYHLHSSTFKEKSSKKLFFNERNRIFNLITYGTFYQIITTPPFTIKRYLKEKKSVSEVKSNKFILIITLLKSYFSVVPNLFYFINKRFKIGGNYDKKEKYA